MNFDCTTNSGCIYISLLYQCLLGLALFVISNFSVKKFISIAYKFQIIDERPLKHYLVNDKRLKDLFLKPEIDKIIC
jgi:hypothetical protein